MLKYEHINKICKQGVVRIEYKIRGLQKEDWSAVKEIYIQGINTNLATFQKDCPEYPQWNQEHLKHSRLVVSNATNSIVAWAALTKVSNRCVYSGVAEVSIYVSLLHTKEGIGYSLLSEIVRESEKNGIWTLQASIMEENIASIKLHEKCGFRTVGYREKIGRDISDTWRNTILMEKRSQLIV